MKRKKICSIITAAVVTASLTIQSGYQVMAIEKPSVKSLASSVRGASDNKLELKMNTSNTNSTANSIALQYTLKNTSSEAVDLAGVKINYYYSSDEDKKQNFVCDYSGGMVGGSYKGLTQCIQGTVAKTGLEDPTKSDCIGVGFSSDAGSLLPGEEIQIQIRVYRDDWSNYDQSNDYSFNDANKVEVSVNGSVNLPVNPPQKKDAKLTSTQGTFDKAEPKDLNVGMELNGNTLKSIKNDTTNKELVANSDYKSTTSNTALLKEYLNKLEVGTYTLSFVFDNNTVTYTVNIVDTSVPAEDQLGIKVGDVKGEAGETVSVPVELTNVPEKGLYGYSFTIKYDNTKFDGVKVTPTDLNPSAEDNFIATVDEAAGTIKLTYVSSQIDNSETIFKNGKIADINFHIKDNATKGESDLTFTKTGSAAYVNDDYTSGAYKIAYDNGSITVVNGSQLGVNVGEIAGLPGETVSVPVEITGAAKKGVYGYSFTIKYDNTKFDGVKVTPTDLNPSAEDNFIATVDEKAGTIKISYVSSQIDDSETIFKDGKIADISFHIKNETAPGTYKVDAVEGTGSAAYVNADYSTGAYEIKYNDGSIEVTDAPVKDVELTLGTAQGEAGKTVTVPVNLSSVDKEGVYGYSFTIKYDNTKFDGVEVIPTDLNPSAEDNFIATVDEKAGTIKISYVSSQIDDSETIFKDGKIADISFHIKNETAPGTYKVDAVEGTGSAAYVNADYSTGAYEIKYNDGSIEVTDAPVKDVELTLGTAQGEAGKTVTVPVNLSSVDKEGVYGYSFTIKYDNTKFDGVEVIPTDLNPSAEDNFIATVDEATGTIKISYVSSQIDDSETIFTDGKIADIKFNVKSETAEETYKVDAVEGTGSVAYVNADYSTGSYDVKYNDGSISVKPSNKPIEAVTVKADNATVEAGSTVTVPVSIDTTSTKGVYGYSFVVSYDNTKFDGVEVVPSELNPSAEDNFIATVDEATGTIKISYVSSQIDDSETIKENGKIADIKLHAKETAAVGSTTLDIKEDTTSFAYVNSDYTPGAFVVEAVDGTVEITAKSTPKPEVVDSTLKVSKVTYDPEDSDEISVGVNFNGNKLVSINDGTKDLELGEDYRVTSKKVVLSESYLQSLPQGKSANLTLKFSAGKDAKLEVEVLGAETPIIENSTINPTSIELTKGEEKDTTIALDLKGNTLKAIKDANGNAVKYTNAGSSVVLSKDYLASLAVGTTNLTFEFSAGENATLAVKVNAAKPVQEGQLISVDSIKAKAGDTITVPVKITGTPKEGIGCFSIELGFDTNYLEFVSATAGDIVTNAKSNFSADYFESDNIVSSFFTYNKKKSDQIVKDGTYMNVTFKVKAGVKGTTKLKVSEGNVISAKPSREDIPFTLSIGDIVIE